MLILLASLFLFGGDNATWSLNVIEERIEAVVTDQDRAGTAKVSVDDIGDALDEFNNHYEDAVNDLTELHNRYDATRDNYTVIVDTLKSNRQEMNRKLLAARATLKRSLSRVEWEQIFVPVNGLSDPS